jgi:DNA-binding NarL/FixJ family response regulator
MRSKQSPDRVRETLPQEFDCRLLDPANPGEDLLSAEDWAAVGERLHLTVHELPVAVLLFEGKTRASIARRLKRSPSAVRVRIDQLFHKLRVRDRVGLVLRIVRVWLMARAEVVTPFRGRRPAPSSPGRGAPGS